MLQAGPLGDNGAYLHNGALFDVRNKASPTPLFYVEGPVQQVPNPNYDRLQSALQATRLEAEQLRQRILDGSADGMDFENVDDRFTEGTARDKSNIVMWMRFRAEILAERPVKKAFADFWQARIAETQQAMYNMLKANNAPLYATWETNNRNLVNELFRSAQDPITGYITGFDFTGIPPTNEFARWLLSEYLNGSRRAESIRAYLNHIRSPRMWAWGRQAALTSDAARIYWSTVVMPWLSSDPSTEAVAAVFEFLNANTGAFLSDYTKAKTTAEKLSALALVKPSAELAGKSRDEVTTVVREFMDTATRDAKQDPNLPVIYQALRDIVDLFNVAFISNTSSNESRFIVDLVGQYIEFMNQAVIMSENATLAILNTTISALQLSGVGADQMFSTTAKLLDNEHVLVKLRELIQTDYDVLMGDTLKLDKPFRVLRRDEAYEWFRTRSWWARHPDIAKSDSQLDLIRLRTRYKLLAELINNTSEVTGEPIVLTKKGNVDQLVNRPRSFGAIIVDKRPVNGGPGGYQFTENKSREYVVQWKFGRRIPNESAMFNGELTDREGVQRILYTTGVIGNPVTVKAGGEYTLITSPVFRNISDYSEGDVWCEVTSVDDSTAKKTAVVKSVAVHFETLEFCLRCGTYYNPITEQKNSCIWFDPETQIEYRGKCNNRDKQPTQYDSITGVRGSVPTPRYTRYDFDGIYAEVEKRIKPILDQFAAATTISGLTLIRSVEESRRTAHTNTRRQLITDDMVALEQLMRHILRYPFTNDPMQPPHLYTPAHIVSNWLTQYYAPTHLSFVSSV